MGEWSCACGCEEEILQGEEYYNTGNGDKYRAECFDEFADEAYRNSFNDHHKRTRV